VSKENWSEPIGLRSTNTSPIADLEVRLVTLRA
jgi:hypothetical protein